MLFHASFKNVFPIRHSENERSREHLQDYFYYTCYSPTSPVSRSSASQALFACAKLKVRMYLGIDVGGTKTLVASLDDNGVIQECCKFATPKTYADFLDELAHNVAKLATKKFIAAGVGVPGKLNRARGTAIALGNENWRNVPVQKDIKKFVHCPVAIENDANLGGLSEAMLVKNHRRVLYVTISTGIGTGFIVDQKIEPNMADSEGGQMLLEHDGKLEAWEDFASGRAIVQRFGKPTSKITDRRTWQIIGRDIAIGLIDLIALMQPEVIVLGGGVGAHYDKFKDFLHEFLDEYENPLFTMPIIQQAARPELAVVYGCYDLAKQTYG
jgi:predicted NBD/HSP70 family sugar kinase